MSPSPRSWVRPCVLTHQRLNLIPLSFSHFEGLVAAAADGELWRQWYTGVPGPGETAAWIRAALVERDREGACPFTIVEAGTERIIGSTRFCAVDAEARRLEVGETWFAASAQGVGYNLTAKLLMLTHAFAVLGASRVLFRVDCHNHRARTALERLGATPDGLLQRRAVARDGCGADALVYSILADEWPAVHATIETRLAQSGELGTLPTAAGGTRPEANGTAALDPGGWPCEASLPSWAAAAWLGERLLPANVDLIPVPRSARHPAPPRL